MWKTGVGRTGPPSPPTTRSASWGSTWPTAWPLLGCSRCTIHGWPRQRGNSSLAPSSSQIARKSPPSQSGRQLCQHAALRMTARGSSGAWARASFQRPISVEVATESPEIQEKRIAGENEASNVSMHIVLIAPFAFWVPSGRLHIGVSRPPGPTWGPLRALGRPSEGPLRPHQKGRRDPFLPLFGWCGKAFGKNLRRPWKTTVDKKQWKYQWNKTCSLHPRRGGGEETKHIDLVFCLNCFWFHHVLHSFMAFSDVVPRRFHGCSIAFP